MFLVLLSLLLNTSLAPPDMAVFDILISNRGELRGQFLHYPTDIGTFIIECSYGLGFTTAGWSQTLGGGARFKLNLCSECGNNFWYISPGVAMTVALKGEYTNDKAWYGGPYTNIYFLTPNLDFAFVHKFNRNLAWESGIHLEIGYGLSGRDGFNRSSFGLLNPNVGLYSGIRF